MDIQEIVIVGGARTPFGKFGGSLRDVTATELGVAAAKGALEATGVPAERVDHVIFGNVIQSSRDAAYLGRHVGLWAGVPEDVPGLTLNRLCGSGFEAIVDAARMITCGEASVVLAGGAENMSQAPLVARDARWGIGLGEGLTLEDSLWQGLTDSYNNMPMAITAENVARRYEVTREEQDVMAFNSQQRAAAAWQEGRLAAEVVPVEGKDKRGKPVTVAVDEHVRPDTTMEVLGRLPARFIPKDGTVTAGNASGIVDGAAAVIVTTAGVARELDVKPLARLVSWGIAGVSPDIMGIGPAPATRIALKRAGMTLADIGLFEINEAFAAQCLACARELDLDTDILNVNGGAISIGHPLGATGTRLVLTLLKEMQRRGVRFGSASMCIGGGMGAAGIFELIN
ncbi:MAG: acetyl-CoA C-acetyltransferase [Caldilineae bacterium]|nr:acetyl-CoA C-acetyltransferase [Anaerolineae bacterium]MCB0253120.1 acetyl-CoA C-acetyltransferase [Anaerolineae bacterium]MCB9154611.1 acetyl-CoA C-acetyltransferase [Caldilineae bacterium]